MKNDNDMYMSLLSRYNEYQEKKKARIRIIRHTAPVTASLCFSAVFAFLLWDNFSKLPSMPITQDITDEYVADTFVTTTISAAEHHSSSQTTMAAGIASANTTVTRSETKVVTATEGCQTQTTASTATNIATTVTEPQQPSDDPPVTKTQPATETPTIPFTEQPTEPTSGNSENPNGVYSGMYVDYDTAKAAFSHPIVPCSNSNFISYKLGIVSQNGNTNSNEAFCLEVTYIFNNGTISVMDQDRLTGCRYTPGVRQYEYLGRTFSDERYCINDTDITIGYYPNIENGLAYVAIFDNSVDIYEIMDLIISIEI